MLYTRSLAAAAACTLAITGAATANLTTATYVGDNGIEGMGTFVASVTYDYSGGPSASLTIAISNTTSASYGGYITAIALSGAGGSVVSSMTSASAAAFNALSGPIAANPFGSFEAGASTGDSWNGGGSPLGGIEVGSAGIFTFTVTGSAIDLGALTAATVLSPENGYGMAVRFRGMTNGGSDKVIGYFIPGPGALALLGAAGLCGTRRRRTA